jgi:hypothetical protein
MNAQSFKDAYMQKFMNKDGPKMAAIIKTLSPVDNEMGYRGWGYDAERVDLAPRVLKDEVIVPYTKFDNGSKTGRMRSRQPGSTGMPFYSGGLPASNFPGAQELSPSEMREMQVPEHIIKDMIPGNVPVYVDTFDKDAAGIIDRYNATGERPGVIIKR